ncbi:MULTISPECIES: TetR/AcrR family transcriptional regulator [Amycolatopsis]|uniref:TetR/AcrR family transcriptional regulator C-terminal domain-containing protein n=1 Tax=Amycolatopsis thermalba TaxID=944492 RepID=A0ABY4NR87_9PSEU|nr:MULTISPECIES: TetR/AcrR family transcriptional regulator C-terminal domain-containing protein [Amycolatopsis]OXM61804.1 TetR family transcriptional regulator [Amycolatopsis sp. KNN50.9b]UQS22582.1 TetR/AcrR family transcriptional regulator C-terminal domain-containing protein [Amycolatopsis thermalba]
MPRPRSLTTEQIAAAALAVLDREGLDALSMRTVAGELGMGTMSLYRYVSDRDQLEGLVVELVLRAIDLTVPRGSAGRRLSVLADRVRVAVSRHPAVVPLLLIHRHRAPSSTRWGETMLSVLTDAGITGKRRAIAFRAIMGYVFGALQVEHFGALSGPGTAALAELPPEEFPILSETAAQARSIPPEEEFRQGFAILLRGLGL